MDEPTSNIDADTDARMQETIRDFFAEATVLTIAHRLQTIMDCDRVAVMGAGVLLECAAPSTLLDDPHSHFHAMAAELGDEQVKLLREASRRVAH